MFKMPRQEYTTEFKELAVKRVSGGEAIARVARELGLIRAIHVRFKGAYVTGHTATPLEFKGNSLRQ